MRSIETNALLAAPRPDRRPNSQPLIERSLTMKRNLILIASAVLALGTNVALAEDQFMDPYWKQLETAHSALPATASEPRKDFDFVDRYPAQ
jgi:hypothetical protein